jgi:hypothetical protein
MELGRAGRVRWRGAVKESCEPVPGGGRHDAVLGLEYVSGVEFPGRFGLAGQAAVAGVGGQVGAAASATSRFGIRFLRLRLRLLMGKPPRAAELRDWAGGSAATAA